MYTETSQTLLLRTRAIYTQKQIAEKLEITVRTLRRWEKGEQIPTMATACLKEMLKEGHMVRDDRPKYGTDLPSFRFIDLFAGIGGCRMAFERAGGKCVFTSEWDKFACQTYRANFSDDHEIQGDITTIHEDIIPDHEVLVGGFPCQPFSLAGVSKKNSLGRKHGFEDETQGTLFFDVARIIDAKKPKAFLLENVKNLKSHDKGKTFEVICRTLRNLGYFFLEHKVIDAAGLLPQHRERVFIVGFREHRGFDWSALRTTLSEAPVLSDILHGTCPSEFEPEEPYSRMFRGKIRASEKYHLSDKLWEYLQAYARKHAAKGNGFGCQVVGPNDRSRTLSARYHKDGSEILIREKPRQKKNPRRLTPRECARLMGFPESFQIPVSDTQAYRQFGNSVAVPVVLQIARAMSATLAGDPLPSLYPERQLLLRSENGVAIA